MPDQRGGNVTGPNHIHQQAATEGGRTSGHRGGEPGVGMPDDRGIRAGAKLLTKPQPLSLQDGLVQWLRENAMYLRRWGS